METAILAFLQTRKLTIYKTLSSAEKFGNINLHQQTVLLKIIYDFRIKISFYGKIKIFYFKKFDKNLRRSDFDESKILEEEMSKFLAGAVGDSPILLVGKTLHIYIYIYIYYTYYTHTLSIYKRTLPTGFYIQLRSSVYITYIRCQSGHLISARFQHFCTGFLK